MGINHLSEELLQSIVEGRSTAPEESVHLSECAGCRHRLAALRLVSESLREAPKVVLPQDFSWKVISAIEQREESRKVWKEWLLYGTLGIIGVAITLFFTGSNMTIEVLAEVARETWEGGSETTSVFTDVRSLSGDGSLYVVYLAFLLFVYDYLDQRFVQRRHPTA